MLKSHCKEYLLTNLSDWVHWANSVKGAELWPVGDFNWLQQELAPPVVAVFTYHPATKQESGHKELLMTTVSRFSARYFWFTISWWSHLIACKLPAAVDSERQDMVVEAFFYHTQDLCVCGDLSALQTLKPEQRDGRNWEQLEKERAFSKAIAIVCNRSAPITWNLPLVGLIKVAYNREQNFPVWVHFLPRAQS